MSRPPRQLFSRRSFLSTTLLGGVGSAGAFTYAGWIEPTHLTVTHQEVLLPGLPPELDGLVIAQLTDFHYEPERLDKLIADAVAASNAASPDIVALTGDFITKDPSVFEPLMEHLSLLKAKHGILGIMGNHDGWHAPYSLFRRTFQRVGFDFLINQNTQITIDGQALFLFGTDSIWSGSIDLPACYRGLKKDTPVLGLVHEPDVFDLITPDFPVDLQLSGHTHGGQCCVPIIGYAPKKPRFGKRYLYGTYTSKHQRNSRLFVSRGLGTVGFHVRFACPPEVAILTLKNATI